ncbi:SDR family oxidoreductase [Pontibacter silvestris]|uniref:SDR family oxidoreductase n=2 Tax=Pontibacter silvestris TaxID=2305183 RepID=A0ABW4WW83_9BACT|nr:SDR family oxidoreductase [Pontibacter silvestris]MCC9137402.1 SDR family oxidoreductase [Pontibacter silvestris]
MAEKADISIMGCGWLGLPLATQLVQKEYRVNGSTTSPVKVELLQKSRIYPYVLNLQNEPADTQELAAFLDSDILVLNIPPRLRSDSGEKYLHQLKKLLKALINSTVRRLLFVSSTSVYPDINRIVKEEDIAYTDELDPDNILLQAERMFQDRGEWLTTIVRFSGLVGNNRHPGRFMAGKRDVPNGDAPVNLIHLDDCVSILSQIIEQKKWGQVYNACADEHPARKDFYTKAAIALNLAPPQFNDMQETQFKRINSQKLKDDLAYSFLHPDPMKFF